MNHSIVLGAMLLLGSPAEETLPESIYKVDSPGVPAGTDHISFIEARRLVADYRGENPDRDAMNPKSFREYTQVSTANAVVLGYNGINVPYGIEAGKKWQEGDNSCSAGSRDGKRILVICGPRLNPSTTSTVYMYEHGRGITGFFAPCFIDKACWFQLQSKKGILATLPPRGR